jgi:fatty-acyl-CoA synthase
MEWNIGCITTKWSMLAPERTALIYEDKPVSYKELNDRANRVAHFLKEKGIKKGDRISVMLLNCPEFFEIYFAAAKLGVIFVPLNFRLASQELEYQLNNCGSRMLLFHDVFHDKIKSIRSRVKVEIDKFIFLRSLNPDSPSCPEWAGNFEEKIKFCSIDEPEISDQVNFNDPLAILFTSGTTDVSKGALFSHQQIYFKNFEIMLYTDMRTDDVVLVQLPLFRSGGLFNATTPVFNRGATFILRERFNPEQFAKDIEKYRVTIIFSMLSAWDTVIQSDMFDKINVSSVRFVFGGGGMIPRSLFEKLVEKGLYIQQGYGQTENPALTILPKADVQRKVGSVGLPGFFTHVWITDEKGNKLPPNQIGEIAVRGPTITRVYWNMPEKTNQTIINGVFHTGDLGYRDSEGYFYLVGRIKNVQTS